MTLVEVCAMSSAMPKLGEPGIDVAVKEDPLGVVEVFEALTLSWPMGTHVAESLMEGGWRGGRA